MQPALKRRTRHLALALLIPALFLAALFAVRLPLPLWADGSPTAPYTLDIGYEDFSYGDTVKGDPSGEKPESKLWWNDGLWWAVLWNDAAGAYQIYWLDWGDQVWRPTGVTVDTRAKAKVDTMWDGATGKLYVATHIYTERGSEVKNAENFGRLYRFSYDAARRTYAPDPGFPVTVNRDKTETLVLAKDSQGRLWVAYVSRPNDKSLDPDDRYVYVNASAPNDDLSWGTPVTLPVPITATDAVTVSEDDIATIIAFRDTGGTPKIGVMWTNGRTKKLYFAVHDDTQPITAGWTLEEPPLPADVSGVDDHINVKRVQAGSADRVLAAVKTLTPTTDTTPLIGLVVRDTDGSYTFVPYSTRADRDTRPIVVVDEDQNKAYVFVTGKPNGSKICYKAADLAATPTITFTAGDCGTSFIEDDDDHKNEINNATSTKQNVNATTGLVVLATDDNHTLYVHNVMGDPPPVVTLRSPGFDAVDVPIDFVVRATFSKRMKSSTVTTANLLLESGGGSVAGTVGYDGDARTATFTPTATIWASTRYTVTVTQGLRDTSNQPLYRQERWSFTTVSPTVQFQVPAATVNEDVAGGSATVTVTLNAPSSLPVSVTYASADGTATAGSDYTAVSGTLIFAPGETAKAITVPILDDGTAENPETFNVTLSAPTNAGLGTSTTTLTIADDEGPPALSFDPVLLSADEENTSVTLRVRLSHPSANQVQVDYATADNTATANSDYVPVSGTLTFAPGETTKTFTVTLFEDTIDEPDEALRVTLSNPANAALGSAEATVTILDDDPAPAVQFSAATANVTEGLTATLTATLSAPSALTVTVEYATQDLSAKAGSDYTAVSGTLTFAPGETAKAVAVPILDDALDEAAERFNLLLDAPVNAALGATDAATVEIADDDPAPTVQLSADTFAAGEADGLVTVTVTLSAPSGRPVSVKLTTVDGSARAGRDYTPLAQTITFAPGETAKAVTIVIADTDLFEGERTFSVMLSAPANATLGTTSVGRVTIAEDEYGLFLPVVTR